VLVVACGGELTGLDGNPGPGGGDRDTVSLTADESELVTLINAERAQRGLEPVTVREDLTCSVQRHSIDIGDAELCGHTGTDGSGPTERVAACGGGSWSGEIVACGQTSPRAAVEAWLSSPGHSATMLDPGQREIGVAMHNHYWTAIFDQ
jgi:uncharacterized protein YkwD